MKAKTKTIKGYKVTDENMQCRGYQYELNKTYKEDGSIELCEKGFHFCLKPSHCFNYYEFTSDNRVFEIEASGTVINGDDKSCSSEIKFVKEIEWKDVLVLVNEGRDNTGHSNTGNRNTGNSNTGDWNTGDWNTGDWNTGDWNTGNSNTGNSNTGNSNTGNWNTGYRNTGYSNTGNRNTGAFCTIEPPFMLFNKESNWTEKDFLNSKAYSLMRNYVETKIWIPDYKMTEEEKEKYPSYKTAEGYVKDIPFKEAFKNAWHNWSEGNRKAFAELPNFDATVFEEITGVTL
jgi:hypothetical protein